MTKITSKKKPLFLSWLQLRKERARLIVAIAGISFADVLMFLQMGFRGALFSSAVEFHHSLNGEIVMMSSRTRSLISLDLFTERRLYQAASITGVASVSPIYLNSIQWRNPENKEIWDIYAIGINPEHQVLNIPGVETNREKLRQPIRLCLIRGLAENLARSLNGFRQAKQSPPKSMNAKFKFRACSNSAPRLASMLIWLQAISTFYAWLLFVKGDWLM